MKFIPAPCCKGKGGFSEPIWDVPGDGPYHPCLGCNDERTMEAYLRVKKFQEDKFVREDAITCNCGHAAWWHYERYNGCGATAEFPMSIYLKICSCQKSKEEVMA